MLISLVFHLVKTFQVGDTFAYCSLLGYQDCQDVGILENALNICEIKKMGNKTLNLLCIVDFREVHDCHATPVKPHYKMEISSNYVRHINQDSEME